MKLFWSETILLKILRSQSFKRIYLNSAGSWHQSSVAVRNGKISPGQETGLGNRERLKVLNDTKLVLNEQFLALDFFCRFLQQDGSNKLLGFKKFKIEILIMPII